LTNAAFQGTQFYTLTGQAQTVIPFAMPWVIVLAPNVSILLNSTTLNENVTGLFQWMEV